MLGQWLATPVEPNEENEPPTMENPQPVAVPGRPTALAGADAVAYRTTFSDPRDADETRATLELNGLYGRTRIWLDGTFLGSHESYFTPARFEFEPSQENELVVECRRPTDAFGGIYETDLLPADRRVPGIWWDATVEPHGPVAITDLSVTPQLGDDGAAIHASITVDAAEPVDDRITLSLRPEGFRGGGTMERAHVEAAAGERVVVERRIDVRDPKFWWPRGFGSQHRYAVHAKLGEQERVATTGFSRITYDEDGLLVNGRSVPARGFNVLPGADPGETVERALDANANLLRAHAHVPSPEFYEACDEAGLLVWQDLPLTGPVEYDPERGIEVGSALGEACESYPSVAAYGVHDDPRSPFDTPLGSGRVARTRVRWRAWRTSFDRTSADAVADGMETDRPVFPVSGPPGTAPDAAHLYPGWEYGTAGDIGWLTDTYPGIGDVVTEFGAGSLTDVDDSPGVHAAFEGLDGTPVETQREQGRTLKHVVEALRRDGTDLLAAFSLQDVRPGGGMGVVDAAGHEKASFDAIAAAYEPVQVVADEPPTGGAVGLTLLNDTHDHVSGTVEWVAGSRTGTVDIDVEPLSRASAGGAKIDRDADDLRLHLTGDGLDVRNRYQLS
ncbi:glycoside hydrolase family 2 [Natronoarchaeum sp. GCM10025321]|uniref:glycoside hydrolase family 2 n=1 Tax=Natronoarchaeum sp. GCM10025321 TaxID=3252684 RepID=UPI00361264F0